MTFALAPFFAVARKRLVRLRQPQVAGIERIVLACMARWTDHRWTACALANVEHETGRLFQPIRERGSRSYFAKYEPGTEIGRRLGNVTPGDGWRYRGASLVQVTGLTNFRRASEITGIDLVAEPDRLLEWEPSLIMLTHGMERGIYTGKALPDYFNETTCDWRGSRRIINGLDKADLIAGYAQSWHAAIQAGLAPAKVTP